MLTVFKFAAQVPANDPARKGQTATRKQLWHGNRYAVAPVHTRFDALEWFVWDAEHPDSSMGNPTVIRQEPTFEKAIEGLPPLVNPHH